MQLDWTVILSWLAASSALFAALGWLTRSLIAHFLSRDVERFKASLQLSTLEHQIRFSSLHEKQATLVAEFYEKLQRLRKASRSLCYHVDMSTSEVGKSGQKLAKLYLDAKSFFEVHQIYFSEEICNKMVGIIDLTADISDEYMLGHIEEGDSGKSESIQSVLKVIERRTDSLENLLEQLGHEFRRLLGVPKGT
jgi:signal transduction histidine kinase